MAVRPSFKVQTYSKQHFAVHGILHLEDTSWFFPFFVFPVDIFFDFIFVIFVLYPLLLTMLPNGLRSRINLLGGGFWVGVDYA